MTETSELFNESLTKAAASEKIDELKARSPRLHQDGSNGAASGAKGQRR
jgi:hypothetical protein